MQQVTQQLSERFPLLDNLVVRLEGSSDIEEKVPLFARLIISVLENPLETPLCFVFPRHGDSARAIAVLYAALLFQRRCINDLRKHARDFKTGQRVQVHPTRHVFLYDGCRENDQDTFYLRTLNGSGARNFPLSHLVRLEPTERKLPTGRLDLEGLNQPSVTPLDRLLATSVFGNSCHAINDILLLDHQGEFEKFVNSHFLHPPSDSFHFPLIENLLPCGKLTLPEGPDGSWFRHFDGAHSVGEPLVAVTSNLELLRDCCSDIAPRSKLVLINGLDRVASNLQAFDDLVQRQHVVLFAEQADMENIKLLGDRGCTFWWLESEELDQASNPAGTVFGSVSRWACNDLSMQIKADECASEILDGACLRLIGLNEEINATEDGVFAKCVGKAWSLLNEAAASCRSPGEAELHAILSDVDALRQEIKRHAAWFSDGARSTLNEVACALEKFFRAAAEVGYPKGNALISVVSEANERKASVGIIARSEIHAAIIRQFLDESIQSCQVFCPRSLPEEIYFDELIITSWLGGDSMSEVIAKLTAPKIHLLAYSFESRWLQQLIRRLRRRPSVPSVSDDQKGSFVTGRTGTNISWPGKKQKASVTPIPPSEATDNFDVWRFERQLRAVRKGNSIPVVESVQSIPARYISFAGSSFAFLTATHRVPVVTSLLQGNTTQSHKLPERLASELKRGDYVVFPESGDREFVYALADKLLGEKAVKLRRSAHLWKDALWKRGMTIAEFHRHAQELGHPRHIATIRNWFADTTQIGPQTKDDLLVIRLVTGDLQLETESESVWNSIEELRGAHLSAGMRLRDVLLKRLPEVLSSLDDNGTKVDLGELGSAWIVQVEEIAATDEPRLRTEINRLHWD